MAYILLLYDVADKRLEHFKEFALMLAGKSTLYFVFALALTHL